MTQAPPSPARKTVVLAFSGGLDTSYCVVHLREELGYDVVTAIVDTGGYAAEELREIEKKALSLGAKRHVTIDGRQELWDRVVGYLVKGNVLRGGVYPLAVAAERVIQAERVAALAKREQARAIAHGCTGAGNDQARFEAAFTVLAPELEVIAPIRDLGITRDEEARFLTKHGFPVQATTRDYSVNAGLWGTTVGGKETHDPFQVPPESLLVAQGASALADTPDEPEPLLLRFRAGLPVAVDERQLSGLEIVETLNRRARRHAVGRGIHLGDTVLGFKGRIVFEAPAPIILVKAHRELEKLVLTQEQQTTKERVAERYGALVHEGLYYEPACRDMEALIDSSQRRVEGDVKLRLFKGSAEVLGVRSPFSLMDPELAVYGEKSRFLDAAAVRGFARVRAVPGLLYRRAGERRAADALAGSPIALHLEEHAEAHLGSRPEKQPWVGSHDAESAAGEDH